MGVQSVPLLTQVTPAPACFPVVSSPVPNNSTSNLFAAFRLAQLVNSFRTKIKTRVLSHSPGKETAVQEELSHAFEQQASEEIGKRLLGQTSNHEGKSRVSKANIGSSCPTVNAGDGVADVHHEDVLAPACTNTESLACILDSLEAKLPSKCHSISALANDDTLLLKQGTRFHLKQHHPFLLDLLSTIEALLAAVSRRQGRNSSREPIEDIQHPDWWNNPLFLANLEHILLCLQAQTYALLIGHLVGHLWLRLQAYLDVWACQKAQIRACKQWFFEFPDARHPLSTTWPWSIKPCLAVIWGVCWMFDVENSYENRYDAYVANLPWEDHSGNRYYFNALTECWEDQLGNWYYFNVLTECWECYQTAAEPNITPQPHYPVLDFTHLQTQSVTPHPSANAAVAPRQYQESGLVTGNAVSSSQPQPSTVDDYANPANALFFGPTRSAVEAHSHAAVNLVPNNFRAARLPPHQYVPRGVTEAHRQYNITDPFRRVPQETIRANTSELEYYDSVLTDQSWRVPQNRRITAELENRRLPVSQPQSFDPSHSDVMATQTAWNTGDSTEQQQQSPEHSRGRPLSDDTRTEAQQGRSRSLSSTANALLESAEGEPPAESPTGSPEPAEDEASPFPQRERPRSEPTIVEGKYVCTQCPIKPFDRRCEWNKHMDKHDRPYVCKKPECSSLQGFTYSGGLLRHQREVHHLHGGAKLKLFCHVPGCKRSKHTPFTRRENLAEHLRRVHKLNTPEPNSPPSTTTTITFLSPKTEEGMKVKVADTETPKEGAKQEASQPNISPFKKPASQDVKQNGKHETKPKPRLAAKPAKQIEPVNQGFSPQFVGQSAMMPFNQPINQFVKQEITRETVQNQTAEEHLPDRVATHHSHQAKNGARQDVMKIAHAVQQPVSNSATPKHELIAHDTPTESPDIRKRKRNDTEETTDESWQAEAKRLKVENEELRRAQEASNERMARMEKQISELVSAKQRIH